MEWIVQKVEIAHDPTGPIRTRQTLLHNVVVINAGKVRLTGAKEDQKTYFRASKYIGNHKTISFKEMKEKHPRRILEKAVKGMLPHNALGRQVYRKLYVYAGSDHRHEAQQPEAYELSI